MLKNNPLECYIKIPIEFYKKHAAISGEKIENDEVVLTYKDHTSRISDWNYWRRLWQESS